MVILVVLTLCSDVYISCTVTVNSDKDNNSAVISLGEMCSDNAAQHLSSAGSPPPPPTNGTAGDEALPHRTSAYRCGSPPTGRSVSFMCGQVHRSEADGNGSARMPGRRQSATVGEQKEMTAAVTTVVSLSVSGSTQHHVEDEKPAKLESVRADATTSAMCPSGIRICKCVSSQPSKLSDIEGCRPLSGSGHNLHESWPAASDAEVAEVSQSEKPSKQTQTASSAECCVIHVSSSS